VIQLGIEPRNTGMRLWLMLIVRVIVSAGLAVDAYVHADLADRYDPIGSSISQGNLFRVEAGVAALAALLVVFVAGREAYGLAFLVATSALGAIVLYRYVDVGALGPLPNMYEPIWFAQKTVAAVAEAVALLASLIGLGLTLLRPIRAEISPTMT
jgi:hypothetical protein